MNKHILLPLIVMLFSGSAFAWNENKTEIDLAISLEANIENGKEVFVICTNCHSENGQGYMEGISRRHINGYYPVLAGQHKNVLIKQLSDIRSGSRDNPQMYPFTLSKYIGDTQDIADVAGYIAQLPSLEDKNNIGSGYDLELGKKLYIKNCKECHGANGQGNNKDYYPRLQGQHYNYMLRQFRWIKDGRRRNANREMKKQISQFSYKETKAVIDYTSRLSIKKNGS